ncbi:hypothetical protein WA158_004531 [Blastocystis sp. Blastoise]
MNELNQKEKNELYMKEIDKETESSSMRRSANIKLSNLVITKQFEATKDVVITISLQKNRKEKLFSQPINSNNGEPFVFNLNREFSLFYLHCVKFHRDPILRIALENTRPKTFTRHRSIAAALVSMQQVLQHKFKGTLMLYTCHTQQRQPIGYIEAEISTDYLDDGDEHFESSDEDEDIDEEVIKQTMSPLSATEIPQVEVQNPRGLMKIGNTLKQMFLKGKESSKNNTSSSLPSSQESYSREYSYSTISSSYQDEISPQDIEALTDFVDSLSEPSFPPFILLSQNSSQSHKLVKYLLEYTSGDGIEWCRHIITVDDIYATSILTKLLTAFKNVYSLANMEDIHLTIYLVGTDRFIQRFITSYISLLTERPKDLYCLQFMPIPNGTTPILCSLLTSSSADYKQCVETINSLLNTKTFSELIMSSTLYHTIKSIVSSPSKLMPLQIGEVVLHFSDTSMKAATGTQKSIPFLYQVQFGEQTTMEDIQLEESFIPIKYTVDYWVHDPYSSSGSITTKQVSIPANKLTYLWSYITRENSVSSEFTDDVNNSLMNYRLYIPISQKNKRKWFISKGYMSSIVINNIESQRWVEAKIKKIICSFTEVGEKVIIDGVEYDNCIFVEMNSRYKTRIQICPFLVPILINQDEDSD